MGGIFGVASKSSCVLDLFFGIDYHSHLGLSLIHIFMEETPDMDPVQKEMARMELTSEEQKMVDSFAEKIDVENTAQILQYGAGTQKKMADFSDEALKNVRTQDLSLIHI